MGWRYNMRHLKASLKEKKQAGIFVTRTHTKQHEAPTTNTKAIMVIKEADLFVLWNVEYVLLRVKIWASGCSFLIIACDLLTMKAAWGQCHNKTDKYQKLLAVIMPDRRHWANPQNKRKRKKWTVIMAWCQHVSFRKAKTDFYFFVHW